MASVRQWWAYEYKSVSSATHHLLNLSYTALLNSPWWPSSAERRKTRNERQVAQIRRRWRFSSFPWRHPSRWWRESESWHWGLVYISTWWCCWVSWLEVCFFVSLCRLVTEESWGRPELDTFALVTIRIYCRLAFASAQPCLQGKDPLSGVRTD